MVEALVTKRPSVQTAGIRETHSYLKRRFAARIESMPNYTI